MKNVLVALLLVCFTVGCSSVAHIKTDDAPDLNPKTTNYNDIKVYSTDDVDVSFDVIGQVVADADAGSNADVAVSLLRKEAAKLGADAIIDLRLEIDTGYWQSAVKATGTAVKFK